MKPEILSKNKLEDMNDIYSGRGVQRAVKESMAPENIAVTKKPGVMWKFEDSIGIKNILKK